MKLFSSREDSLSAGPWVISEPGVVVDEVVVDEVVVDVVVVDVIVVDVVVMDVVVSAPSYATAIPDKCT